MINISKKYLYISIGVFITFSILGIIFLGLLYKDVILTKYYELENQEYFSNYLNNVLSGTFIEIEENDKGEKDYFELIQNNQCDEVIKNIISKNTEHDYGGYKDFDCKKYNSSMVSFSGSIVCPKVSEKNKHIKHGDKTVLSAEKKNIGKTILYKTTNGKIKTLSKNYDLKKVLGDDFLIFTKKNNNGIYNITDSKKGNNGIHEVLYKIKDNIDLDNIKLFNSGSITEITLLEKKSTSAKKIIFNKEKLRKKTQSLAQVSCDQNGKCRDELNDVLSNYEIKKDYFGGSIIGNIKKGKITKVIVTPEKNNECELDLEPYELTKFDPESGEFKYNFSLKWKNICPQSGASFIVDLISNNNKKYRVKTSVKGPFYEDTYRNMKFVKEKEEIIEIDFNVLKGERPKIDGKNNYSNKIKYIGYFIVGDIKRYIHKFTWEEMGTTDFFITTDKKIKNAYDIEYLDIDSNKVGMPQVNLDKIRKNKNFVVINSFNGIEKLYQQQLLEGLELSNENILLEPVFSVYEGDGYFGDEKKILFDLSKNNFSYKKTEVLGYNSLYIKDNVLYLKGKNNLMLPASVTIKNDFYDKTLEGMELGNDLVSIIRGSVSLNNIINGNYNFNSSFKNITILGYNSLYIKDNTLYLKGNNNFMIPVSIEAKSEYKYKIENDLKGKNEVFLKNNSKNILKISNNKNLEKVGKLANKEVFQDKSNGCLFVSFEKYPNFGLQYDFFSEDLKIKFLDNKDYGDYTFRFAGQASEIYEGSGKGNGQVKYGLETSSLNKCSHTVSQNDLKPDERLEKAGSYVGFPIYKFKDDNDPYLKRRFREQYGIERGQETGERYEEYVKSLPVLYWNDPFGRWLRVIKMVYMPQAEKMKPVIYLYPEETQKINVKVKPNGGFKLTIPEYPIDNGWDVISTPDSEITFEGETYPYLFWEGKAIGYEIGKKGFVIENNKESIENFLIEKLTLLGLNEIEIVDFNEYWIDKLSLVKNPFIFVTFASKEQQDWDSPLEVTPKPDSIIRVFMDYRGTDTKEKVEELDIITPVRKGFSVVEWGGAKRW